MMNMLLWQQLLFCWLLAQPLGGDLRQAIGRTLTKGESAEPLRPQDGQEGAGNAGDPKEAGHRVEREAWRGQR